LGIAIVRDCSIRMGIPTLSSEQRKGACGFLPIPSKGMGTCRSQVFALPGSGCNQFTAYVYQCCTYLLQ